MYTPKAKQARSQAHLVPLPASPSTSSSWSSPTSRRSLTQSKENGEEQLVRTRWSGYRKSVPTGVSSKKQGQGQLVTRIPRVPSRGKENVRGRGGVRIIKPVVVTKTEYSGQVLSHPPPSELVTDKDINSTTPAASKTIPVVVGAKSPVYISSKAVPDLHNKILAKIRLNKRRSKLAKNTLNYQPQLEFDKMEDKNDSKAMSVASQSEEFFEEREGPIVSGDDLEAYLASMFNMVDTYRTGLVRSSSLLEYLGSLVDLPRLDKWKLEELSRLLDPDKDDRYVDHAQWSKVGQTWIDMMLDPENHIDTSSANTSGNTEDSGACGEVDKHVEEEPCSPPDNVSYGSVEGVGGVDDSRCSSREVELENRVSELSYQLARLGEEKLELEKHLAGSEELALSLAAELETSQKVFVNMSNSYHRAEVDSKEAEHAKLVQEKSIEKTVEEFSKELQEKEDKLFDMEMMMKSLKEENEESRIREELMNKKLVEKFAKCADMEVEIRVNSDLVNVERAARENAEKKLDVMEKKIQTLERELTVKDEEIKSLVCSRIESVGSGENISMVHDVSVDDRVLMEQHLEVNQEIDQVFTPPMPTINKSVATTRGPSASSTPQKDRKGSIAEELQEMQACKDLPSPFCEKIERGSDTKKEFLKVLDPMIESVRKILINQVKSGQSARAMILFNREVTNLKKELGPRLKLYGNPEELKEWKDHAFELKEKLAEANSRIDVLESTRVDLEKKNIPEEIVKEVESKVDAMASMLQITNSVLLGGADLSTPPDCSLEPDTDLSSWQLDLEGIQLVNNNSQLGKKLALYTRCGKKNTLAELGCRSPIAITSRMGKSSIAEQKLTPAPKSLLWQSLWNRLEDLQFATEVSRDLLAMAGDSMKEQSLHHSSIMFPKTVSCQTSPPKHTKDISLINDESKINSQAVQISSIFDPIHSSPSSTCQLENCFCSKNQARSSSTITSIVVKVVLFSSLFFFVFTFFCGFEIEHNVYYPVTWYPIRQALGEWVPTPVTLATFNTRTGQVW